MYYSKLPLSRVAFLTEEKNLMKLKHKELKIEYEFDPFVFLLPMP